MLRWLVFVVAALCLGCPSKGTSTQDGGDLPLPANGVGAPCIQAIDCADGLGCLLGFRELSDPFVGPVFLSGYCSREAVCATDADCGVGGACFRPLEGVSASVIATLNIGVDLDMLGSAGLCLRPCTNANDCRLADGFDCAVPLASLLEQIPGAPTRTYCVPREDPPCDIETSWEVPGTCVLSYSLSGDFEITDAPIAAANAVNPIGPGRLVVRVPSSGGVSPVPASGNALLLCYQMSQRFNVAGVITVTQGNVRVPSSGPGASGVFSTGATPQIVWNECTYNPLTHVDDDWTPDAAASGPGCTHGYASSGDVVCTLGVVCSVGGLAVNHNIQDDEWDQPVNTLTFASDMSTVEMNGLGGPGDGPGDKVEVPNRQPGRTWFNFTGELLETRCTE